MTPLSPEPVRPERQPTQWDALYSTSGFRVQRTKQGFAVVSVDYWADEDKRDPAWIAAREQEMTNRADFRREYLRDWTSPAGDSYYPEFWLYGGLDTYVVACPGVIPGVPILRCWDFGIYRPACVWMQRDPRNGRLWVLRELMPGWSQAALRDEGIDVRSFRDVVLYLSGQTSLSRLHPRSMLLLDAIRQEPRYPDPPWFTDGSGAIPNRFIDFSGPEANYPSDVPADDTQARTRAMILAEAGIFLQIQTEPWEAREDMLRELLRPRLCEFGHESCPGHPGILFDPSCAVLVQGVSGGITFRKGTLQNPAPAAPAKDGYYDHLHDALSYGVVGSGNRAYGLPPNALPPPVVFEGRRRLTPQEIAARQSTNSLYSRFARMMGMDYGRRGRTNAGGLRFR